MANSVGEVKLELDDAMTMKFIASAFMEASASRIQKIKKAFEINKEFYTEVSQLYHVVKHNQMLLEAQQALEHVAVQKKPVKAKKILSVAMTSNQRFVGNQNITIIEHFLEKVEGLDSDILIVGATGESVVKSLGFAHPYKTFRFADDIPNLEDIKKFLDSISEYTSVFLYYPKFVSLMRQVVGVIDICEVGEKGAQSQGFGEVVEKKGEPEKTAFATEKKVEKPVEEEVQAIFEPELSKVLDFFDHQVRTLLFRRVILEIDLSRTAARLMTMSSADERSGTVIKQKKGELRKLQNTISNMKLLETFAAIRGAKVEE